MDAATLVDIFRAEEHCCLLGTDAVRDGVDVPGRALRLIVFDACPGRAPTSSTASAASTCRRGPESLRRHVARLRLNQAYGRLVRRAADRGVFVMLDRQTPTRLLSAFPTGVVVRRVGLAEAAEETRAFLLPKA